MKKRGEKEGRVRVFSSICVFVVIGWGGGVGRDEVEGDNGKKEEELTGVKFR